MPADKVKEEVDVEMPDADEIKQEVQDSMARERTVGRGKAFCDVPSSDLP